MTIASSAIEPSADGVTPFDKIEQRSKDVLREGPRGMDDVQSRADVCLSGVQGGADHSRMSNPANSKDVTTIMDGIKNTLSEAVD